MEDHKMGKYEKPIFSGEDLKIRITANSAQSQHDWNYIKKECQKRGGTWVEESGTIVKLIDGVVYTFVKENGKSLLNIDAREANPPYFAELAYDIEAENATPKKLKELKEEVDNHIQKPEIKKELSNKQSVEIIVKQKEITGPEEIKVVDKDWLTKISLKRWGTMRWQTHLKPTNATLNSPKRRGKGFNPDLIYPGDTFEVIR